MNLTSVSAEFATDFINLVNSMKDISYNGKVDYTLKNGKQTKFEYVTLDKIYALAKENPNFAIIEPLGTNENGESALQVILIHKSGEVITSDYYKLRVNDGGSKQDEGAAITYTKRYALGSFLGICTDLDNDANPNGDGMPLKDNKVKNESGKLTEKQINRMYVIAKGKGHEAVAVNTAIHKRYGKTPPELTKAEYDAVCKGYQDLKAVGTK